MNISNFITWWIQTFVNLGTQLINKIDNIFLIGNVSLLDFIITIVIIEAFLSILLTVPQATGRALNESARREDAIHERAVKTAKQRRREGK